MKVKNKTNKRGRPVESEQQKVDRELLKQKFLENSVEALETIVNIMRFSMDSNARLKASTFILNKVIPEGFVFEDETNRNITVSIITHSADETIPYEVQEQLIREAENEDTEDDEGWGEDDIYIPNK